MRSHLDSTHLLQDIFTGHWSVYLELTLTLLSLSGSSPLGSEVGRSCSLKSFKTSGRIPKKKNFFLIFSIHLKKKTLNQCTNAHAVKYLTISEVYSLLAFLPFFINFRFHSFYFLFIMQIFLTHAEAETMTEWHSQQIFGSIISGLNIGSHPGNLIFIMNCFKDKSSLICLQH